MLEKFFADKKATDLLESLYVPKKLKVECNMLITALYALIVSRLDVKPEDEGKEFFALRIRTKGKGSREVYEGFSVDRVEVLRVRASYTYVWNRETKEFARMFNDSARFFLISEHHGRELSAYVDKLIKGHVIDD